MKITNNGLEELKKYKYISGGYSKLDQVLNQRIWNPLVTYIPMWVAPNLITFTGFLLMITSTMILVVQDYLGGAISPWAHLLQAVMIFIYQTLDAIDGKQARRTNSSTPLGQLFDHGCDALITIFFIIGLSVSVDATATELMVLFLSVGATLYGVNCLEHHTGVMHTNIKNFGVTEAHFLSIGVHLISYVFGVEIWHTGLFSMLKSSLIMACIPVNGVIVVIIFYQILALSKQKQKVCFEIGNLLFYLLICWTWSYLNVFTQIPKFVILNQGILFAMMLCKFIICSKTKDLYPLIHNEQLPFYAFTVLLWFFEIYEFYYIQIPFFWTCFVIDHYVVLKEIVDSVNQIKDFLGIYCFSLQKP